MRIILRQSFPLGRFHATRWKANPFDTELAGEWPPSPWRLTRAVVARWYQWRRESAGTWPADEIQGLSRALCESNYGFYLPEQARQSFALRQYQPVELGWNPAEKKYAARKSYGTSLTQDNAWCPPPDASLFWFISGEAWTPELVRILGCCLERITYFGRAEALTRIRVAEDAPMCPNVTLTENRASDRPAPVLVPCSEATQADVERVTENPLAARNIPQGARLLYAQRPPRPPAREIARRTPMRPATNLLQFALGWAVAPRQRATVHLTSRFRSAALSILIRTKTGGATARWTEAPASVRAELTGMAGKDAQGQPLRGPRAHAEFSLWWDGSIPTRLLAWRGARPFDEEEQEAMLSAAAQELSWAAAGPDAEAWKIKLVPLDAAVPAPPGFDGGAATVWRSLTPYVPPRHHLRGGKPRESEALESQIRRELDARGYGPRLLSVEEIGPPAWVAVHFPRRRADGRSFIGDRRGYRLRITLGAPISGPLRLGHSSSFGLGMFVPA